MLKVILPYFAQVIIPECIHSLWTTWT